MINPFPSPTADPVSRFPVPEFDTLPEDLQTRMRAVQEKIGFVPNIFLALAHRPAEFRAFFAYHDALMERESGLSKAEKEMIVVVTSARNKCRYCIAAHGAALRIHLKDPIISEQLAFDYKSANITERQRVMLELAIAISQWPDAISDYQIEKAREAGFTTDDIWDIGSIAGLFAFSNRLAFLCNLQPNPEFNDMGRKFD